MIWDDEVLSTLLEMLAGELLSHSVTMVDRNQETLYQFSLIIIFFRTDSPPVFMTSKPLAFLQVFWHPW